MPRLEPIVYPPGVVKRNSEYSQEGRWIDSDKIRFLTDYPQKIGGWVKHFSSSTFDGTCRRIQTWRDTQGTGRVGFATNTKVYLIQNDAITDITPLRDSGTLGTDPVTTLSGNRSVEIAHPSHQLQPGDTVVFAGATAVGGLTLDGEHTVDALGDVSDNFFPESIYQIRHPNVAFSTATGGGSAITYEYEITTGREDAATGQGFGIGPFGEEEFGDARTVATGVTVQPRLWSLDLDGEVLILCHRNGSVFKWDPQTDADARAQLIDTAPKNNLWAFMTAERHLVCLGADSDPLRVKWSDQGDRTNFTPAFTNQAGSFRVQSGNEFRGGVRGKDGQNVLFTDTTLYTMTFLETDDIFSIRKRGSNAGLIGPNAVVEHNGVVFFMSDQQFLMFDGHVIPMPNSLDVREHVFDNINRTQQMKCLAGINAEFWEIWFFYPTTGDEISNYVKYNMLKQVWDVGTLDRLAWYYCGIANNPFAAGDDGYIYKHEVGVDDDTGVAMSAFIEGSPADILNGNTNYDVIGVVPDMSSQTGDVTLLVSARDKPRSSDITETATITTTTERLPLRISGRQIKQKYTSNAVGGDFELGKMRFEIEPQGERR